MEDVEDVLLLRLTACTSRTVSLMTKIWWSVMAIVVPVDLPGEKVVKVTNSEEETEELVPSKNFVLHSEDTELC